MNTAGNREQATGNRVAMRVACAAAVGGCRRWAAEGGRYCERCDEEIQALDEIAAARGKRAERRAQQLYHAAIMFHILCAKVRRRLWIPLLACVLAGLLYFFATELGDAFCTWLDGAQ